MLKEADLILSMTRAQRGLVVELWPAAVRRTFTLREFARLLSWVDPSALPAGTPAERLRAAIPLAAAERGRERTSPDEDDVVDPFRLSNAVYANSFAQIASAVDSIVYTIVMNDAWVAQPHITDLLRKCEQLHPAPFHRQHGALQTVAVTMRPSALRGGQGLTALEQAVVGSRVLEPASHISQSVKSGWRAAIRSPPGRH